MVTNRHAYLILAYICPRLLQVMIDMIDDERNDIYIHVDAKVDITNFAGIHSQKSKIIYTDRGKHYWGNDSFVKNEFYLLETALKYGPYMYYHIFSETTLPLKSQDYIHHMLDEEYTEIKQTLDKFDTSLLFKTVYLPLRSIEKNVLTNF